jgi:hypothetical protein
MWVGGGVSLALTNDPGSTLNALPGKVFPQMKKT